MSRTSRALRRFGVPVIAAVTIVAGIPALASVTAANAAAGDVVTITPEQDSASVGTCNPFTITAKNSTGGPATSTVDVNIAERTAPGASATETFDVEFCTDATNNVTPQTPTDVQENESATGNDTDHAEFTVGSDGTVVFGIKSVASSSPAGGPTTGTADIVAFIDDAQSTSPAVTRNDDQAQSSEAQDTAIKTFTASGTPESSPNTPTAGSVNNAVASVDAEPETQTVFAGETAAIDVTVKNAQGDTLVGVKPAGDVTAGPNNSQAVACSASDNDGVSTCQYTAALVGTDTVVIWVNETNPDGNATTSDATNGLDAGESSDTVSVTVATAPTGLTVVLTCGDANTPRTSTSDCQNPLSDNNELFTATVTGPDGTDAGTDPDPAVGVIINFTRATTANADANDTETMNPTSATTDANGVATSTLTDSKPSEGEQVTVTATIRGQVGGTNTDTATKTWRTPSNTEARNISLTPASATSTPGSFREFQARVTNAAGQGVPGVTVTFDESGPGAFRNGSSQTTGVTDANGVARVEVTSTTAETGTQTITASIAASTTDCELLANNPTSGNTAGNCTDSSTNNWTTTASPSTPPSGRRALTLVVNTPNIPAGSAGRLTATGAANEQYQLMCYTRPSTTYFVARSGTFNAAGDPVTFTLSLGRNTRCFIQYATTPAQGASGSVVINVRTVLSLSTVRTGVRTYIFQGRNLPRVGGQRITLYRVDNAGNEIITAYLITDSSGIYRLTRKFTGTGTFQFKVRTPQTLSNAAGVSNVITVRVF